ncbi:MAG: TIM barrel protein [Candidatus Hadarchaeales archaeon]
MIFLGPAGVPLGSPEKSTLGGLRYLAKVGLNAMEVQFVRGVTMSREMAEEVGKEARKLGIRLSVHCPYFVNLCSPEEGKVRASQRRILESVERAERMGAWVATFHPGFYGKLSPEEALERVREGCSELRREMERKGWGEVRLGLETMGKQGTFGTLEEVVEVCGEVEGCVPVVDWAHLYARKAGELDYGWVFENLKGLGLERLHTHFTGVEFTRVGEGRGNEKHHLELSSEKPPFEPLAREILKRKVEITLISESPVLERDSLVMKEIFRRLGHRFP